MSDPHMQSQRQANDRKSCATCQALERWAPEDLEPGRKDPIIGQTWEPGTRTLDGEEHTCCYATCDDCKEETCECDGYRCDACDAILCPECSVATQEGYFCDHCCVSGYSYRAVTELVESNYRLRKALREAVSVVAGPVRQMPSPTYTPQVPVAAVDSWRAEVDR